MTTVELRLAGSASLYFSYGQVLAYDSKEQQPGSIWTEQHIRQGFVRRPYSVGFGTLTQDGTAAVRVFRGNLTLVETYERVVSVPIELPSGVLRLEGPEEYPIERAVDLKPGAFRLTVAQTTNQQGVLCMDFFIEDADEPNPRSKVLKSDDCVSGFDELSETGIAAG